MKRTASLLAILALLAACQVYPPAKESEGRPTDAVGFGFACMSQQAEQGKSCDETCSGKMMACTSVESAYFPFTCSTPSAEKNVTGCRCCKIVQ